MAERSFISSDQPLWNILAENEIQIIIKLRPPTEFLMDIWHIYYI